MKQKATRRTIGLAGRINIAVIATLVIGLSVVAWLFASSLTQTREALVQRNLTRESDILYLSIENFMMPGEAPIAARYLEQVAGLGSGFSLGLFRRNGVSAFSDNATIEIGSLAQTVNNMVDGLHERYELTKYVSTSTIASLASGQGPTKAERTLLDRRMTMKPAAPWSWFVVPF